MSRTKRWIDDLVQSGNNPFEVDDFDEKYHDYLSSELIYDINQLSISEIVKKYGNSLNDRDYRFITEYKIQHERSICPKLG